MYQCSMAVVEDGLLEQARSSGEACQVSAGEEKDERFQV